MTADPYQTAWMVAYRAAHPGANRAEAIRAYRGAHGVDTTIGALWVAYRAAS